MSDQDYGKKEIETEDLIPFIEAYEYVTGQRLDIIKRIENPDFICQNSKGITIGVELTKVMRDPRDASWDRIIERKYEMSAYDSLETITHLIKKKEVARSKRYITKVKESILVLQLIDGSLTGLKPFLNDLIDDFKDHGFSEIWLADYTGFEAYGDIELFCLFPGKLWGYYQRPWPDRKPFG